MGQISAATSPQTGSLLSGIQQPGSNFPPPVPFPGASISPTHAAPQHNKIILYQYFKPCWKNRLTLKLWRESPDSERKSPTIPPPHHQGF
jgi:hypothetical protein